jgi:flagellar biosynthesis protein FlhF
LNVKRYIADNEAEAMEKVKAELGRDAFILNTRRVRRKGLAGFFQKKLVEIVAAYEPPPPPPPAGVNPLPSLVTSAPAAKALTPGVTYTPSQVAAAYATAAKREETLAPLTLQDVLTGQRVTPGVPPPPPPESEDSGHIRELESKIDKLTTTLHGLSRDLQISSERQGRLSPEVERLLAALRENEVHEEFARKLAREVSDIVHKQGAEPDEVMEQILKQYLGEPSPIRLRRFKRTVVMLVGPTGVGKTTTLAKLAAIYSINHHAMVGVITADTYRIAAVEQLRTYAEILDIPLSVVYEPGEMTDALREHEDKDIVFIDTAGKSPNDTSHEGEIKALIKNAEVDEVHLVISASTSFTGCLNIVNTYGFLRDYKLLFTKLDESPTWGMLLNVKFLTDRPLSYMAAGQTVPDDIEVCNSRKIISRLMESDAL